MFKLDQSEVHVIDTMINSLPNQWKKLLQQYRMELSYRSVDWLLWKWRSRCPLVIIFYSSWFFLPNSWWMLMGTPIPPQTLNCFQIPINTRIMNVEAPIKLDITIKARWFRWIKICTINIVIWKPNIDVCIGKIDTLSMDPTWLQWNWWENFLSYTSATWRNMLQSQNPPPRSIVTKWHGIIPPRLILKWWNV